MLGAFYRAVLPEQGVYALFEGPRKRHVWCRDLDDLTQQTENRADQVDLYFATASFSDPANRTIDNALYRRAFCFDIDAGPAKVAKHGIEKVYEDQASALRGLVLWCQAAGLAPAWIIASGAGLHAYFLLDQDTLVDEWLPAAKAIKAMALAQGLKIDPSVTSDAARILRPVGSLHNNGERVRVVKHLPGAVYSLATILAKTAGFVAPAPRAKVSARPRSINGDILDAPIGPPKSLAKIVNGCAAMAHAVGARGNVPEPYWRAMLGVIKFTIEGNAAAHTYSEGAPDYDYDATQAKYDRWNAGPTTCGVFEAENAEACQGCRHHGKVKSPITVGEMTARDIEASPVPVPPQAPPAAAPAQENPFGSFGDSDDADGISPLSAAEQAPLGAPDADPWTEHMPEGFRVLRTATGGFTLVQKRATLTENEVGDKVTVYIDVPFAAVPFWFESWAPGSHEGDQAQAVYCIYDRTRKTITRYTMPTKLAATRDGLLGALAGQNIQVFPSTQLAKIVMEDYVKGALERIRAAGQRQKIADRFGTMFNEKGHVLVAQGRHIIDRAGNIYEGVVQEKLKSRGMAYRVPLPESDVGKWGPEVWDEYILPRAQRHVAYLREFYSEDNFRPYQLAIMLAWGSPMLAFMQGAYQPGTPLPGIGLTVSLYSPRSGIGKTAAMHAAALAFGVPNAVVLQLDDSNATDNARQGLLQQSGTMPSFMDEMEKVKPEVLAGFVSSVGNGSSKARMTKELAITGGVTTALINVMSTNKSHRELVAAERNESNAVQMRMLEIECSGIQEVAQERGRQETEARSQLHDCAGAVGAVIHRAMCAMGPEALNQLGLECADTARGMMAGRQDGRFMWRALGAMLAVRRILKAAGLQVFGGALLQAEFRKWHDAGYAFSAEGILPSEGLDLMSMMLSELSSKTLITRGFTDMRYGNTKHDVTLNDRVPDEVQVRSVLDGRFVLVKTDAIRDWAVRRKVSHQSVLAKCKQAGVFALPDSAAPGRFTHQVDLYRGTRLAQGVRSSVFKVWIDKLGSHVDYGSEMAPDNVVQMRERTGQADPGMIAALAPGLAAT